MDALMVKPGYFAAVWVLRRLLNVWSSAFEYQHSLPMACQLDGKQYTGRTCADDTHVGTIARIWGGRIKVTNHLTNSGDGYPPDNVWGVALQHNHLNSRK